MKQTIEIEVPDGYEVAEGEQPRLPIKGDWYLGAGIEAIPVDQDYEECHFVILKKKAPEYWKGERYDPFTNYKMYDVVEIKALEDLHRLYVKYRSGAPLCTEEDRDSITAIEGLLK